MHRLSYLLTNQSFIISEITNEKSLIDQLSPGVIFSTYDQLVESTLNWVRKDFQQRDKIAYQGFKIFKQQNFESYLDSEIYSYPKEIKDIDKSHIHKFVKLSNYLKKRRENIQSIFSALLTEDETLTKIELFGVLKNQIHNYEVLTVHSINMIISLVEGKDIIFYEIYESFDKLNVFNSNWENELSEKLTDIETNLTRGLKEIMYSIQEMEISIGNGSLQIK